MPVTTLGPGRGSEHPVLLIAPSPDGELVATVRNEAGVVTVWNVGRGTTAFDFQVREDVITSIDWSSNGRYLAVGGYDGSLYVLDADDDGRSTAVGHEPASHAIQSLAFAPDDRTIATGTFNRDRPATNHVSIWDWQAGKVVQELDVDASSLAFDGPVFAAPAMNPPVRRHRLSRRLPEPRTQRADRRGPATRSRR